MVKRNPLKKLSRNLKKTINKIATVSTGFPRNPEMIAAAIRINIRVLLNCSIKIIKGFFLPRSVSSLVPYFFNRLDASSLLRPFVASVLNSCRTCSIDFVCQLFWELFIIFVSFKLNHNNHCNRGTNCQFILQSMIRINNFHWQILYIHFRIFWNCTECF